MAILTLTLAFFLRLYRISPTLSFLDRDLKSDQLVINPFTARVLDRVL